MRLANIHFYDEESTEELHEATKAAEANPFRHGMTQGRVIIFFYFYEKSWLLLEY